MTALRDAVEKETDRTVMDHIVDGLRQRQSDLTELYSLALRGRNIAVQLAAVRGLGRACKLCYPTYGYQHMAAYLLGEIARKVLDCDPQVREAAAFLLCESENEKS